MENLIGLVIPRDPLLTSGRFLHSGLSPYAELLEFRDAYIVPEHDKRLPWCSSSPFAPSLPRAQKALQAAAVYMRD